MIPFQFVPRGYLHFDPQISKQSAESLATNPVSVAEHSFYPFIEHSVVTQKIEKKPGGGVRLKPPKERPIANAGHGDSHILSHYADILTNLYDAAVAERGLHNEITAFRALGRRNIHFANEAFDAIKDYGPCAVLAADISDFFGSIPHRALKKSWASLLGVTLLPVDHYKVFRAVTKYATVNRSHLFRTLNINPNKPCAGGLRRLCSPKQFRKRVRGAGLLKVNRSGKGIPQGSPISAVLSNIFMLDLDTAMQAQVAAVGGLYRRYCDDILIITPTADQREAIDTFMQNQISAMSLTVHPDKSEKVEFIRRGDRLTTVGQKPLSYLGFTFDGKNKRIRSASIARFYKKMRSGVKRAKALQYQAYKKSGIWQPLRKRRLYQLYSYIGRRNFLSYAFDAAKIMKDDGIKRQVKAHWRRLQEFIVR